MGNFVQFAMNLLNQNQFQPINQNGQEMVNAIRNNDSQRGEELANNILKSYGLTKEQGIAKAKQYFGL